MAISTNSIIHYTSSFNILKAIIKEGFKMKYCTERLELKGGVITNAHPMISFCDIPLSNSFKHFDAYGTYGIGLSKSWASSLGINPVLYLDKNSLIGSSIYGEFSSYIAAPDSIAEEQKNHLRLVKAYTKNYEGNLKRNNVNQPDYRFYDEREWRLVPIPEDIENVKNTIPANKKNEYNAKIAHIRFEFNPNQISYLIVKDDNEIIELINFIRNEYSSKCTAQELDILFSKICSIDQIENDY